MRVGSEEAADDVLNNFVKQFYSGTPFIPREVMLQSEIEDMAVLEQWLSEKRGRRVNIKVPQKGMKEKLVELAYKNALLVLSQDKERIKREEGRTIGAVKEIEGLLGLHGLNRMEAYDISNINGFETVGSMIVYEKGKPKRAITESLSFAQLQDLMIMRQCTRCSHAALYMAWKNRSSLKKMALHRK